MAFRSKKQTIKELIAGIQAASAHEEYDPRADMAVLREQYRELRGGDFSRLLDAMCDKYDAEWSLIHAALASKALAGDLEAIKLYRETQSQGGNNEGVQIIDDL